MNRTTELLNNLKENIEASHQFDFSPNDYDEIVDLIKAELKGRLDVLKDEEEFLRRIYAIRCNEECDVGNVMKILKERLSQIQKEIKEIKHDIKT